MTSLLAVTTCNAEQWRQYGRAMVNTFVRWWPTTVDLWLYTEGFAPTAPLEKPRPPIVVCDLEANAPWLRKFKATYNDPRYTGGSDRKDYRRDAIRFSHKVAALGSAAEEANCDVLLWVDADIVTHAPVTTDWLNSLFPPPATIAWLDRIGSYPECGFLMFRMPEALGVIRKLVDMYKSGSVFHLAETHDSFVLQHIVNSLVANGKLKVHSLSGQGRVHTGHPFANSPLAVCMDHLKGDSRKLQGHSHASDVKVPRNELYWTNIRNGSLGRGIGG